MELPAEFETKMQGLLGAEYPDYLACLSKPRYYGLRVNTNKISVPDFLKISPFPLTPIPWIENGFYYDGETVFPSRHPYYYAGLYYLQEPSAMTPADRLPVSPGDRVLDVCAAPGGKATALGGKLSGTGLLAANDISYSRSKGLLKNLELFGIPNMLVTSEEPGKLAGCFPSYFDKILIDAPCSGEGMFRKDSKMIRAWQEHGPDSFIPLQRSILRQSAKMLRPGGLLLYSTCTFDRREDEGMIEEFLSDHGDFSLVPMKPYEGFTPGIPDPDTAADQPIRQAMRIFPHKMNGEGHFLALLRKKEDPPTGPDTETASGIGAGKDARAKKRKPHPGRLPEECTRFLEQISWKMDPERFRFINDRLYYIPEGLPQVQGLRVLRTGLLMGEQKKGRFEPSQALAMALRADEYSRVISLPCDDERVLRYLKGETLSVSDQVSPADAGWYLFCVDGYPLGFGKLTKGTLKNKYLPGWRITS